MKSRMWIVVSFLLFATCLNAKDDQKPGKQKAKDVPEAKYAEDLEGTLKTARERRDQLQKQFGEHHPQVEELNQFIEFREAFTTLKRQLEKKKAEVTELENNIKALVAKREAKEVAHKNANASPVENKLDLILKRLDQLDKRMTELEKSKAR